LDFQGQNGSQLLEASETVEGPNYLRAPDIMQQRANTAIQFLLTVWIYPWSLCRTRQIIE